MTTPPIAARDWDAYLGGANGNASARSRPTATGRSASVLRSARHAHAWPERDQPQALKDQGSDVAASPRTPQPSESGATFRLDFAPLTRALVRLAAEQEMRVKNAELHELHHRVTELEDVIRRQAQEIAATSSMQQRPRVSLQATFDRLDKIAALEPNWDSYNAEPPTARAVAAAGRLASAAVELFAGSAGESARPWAVAPFSRGVQLEWRGRRRALEVAVNSQGHYGYLLEEGDGPQSRYEEGEGVELEGILDLLARVLES